MTELLELPLDKLKENSWNPRKMFKQKALDELALSIKSNGVLEPLIVRKNGQGFEIIAGARRFRASKIAEKKVVPCIVRVMTDDEAIRATIEENMQREDLSPMEQAHAVDVYLNSVKFPTSVGVSPAEKDRYAADMLGVSPETVARRRSLLQLHPKIQKMAADPDHVVYSWPQRSLEIIARVPQELQKQIVSKSGYFFDRYERADDVKRFVGQLQRDLQDAPWDLSNAKLYAKAGSCDDCTHRSDRQPELFDKDEVKKGCALCLNADCFETKQVAQLRLLAAGLKKEHGTVWLQQQDHGHFPQVNSISKNIPRWEGVKLHKKKSAGDVCVIEWPSLRVSFADKAARQTTAALGGAKKKTNAQLTIEEKRQQLRFKRNKWAVVEVRRRILRGEYPNAGKFTDRQLVDLAARFGMKFDNSGYSDDESVRVGSTVKVSGDRKFSPRRDHRLGNLYRGKLTPKDSRSIVEISVATVISARLEWYGDLSTQKPAAEAKKACVVFKLSWAVILSAAVKAVPEPKSWLKQDIERTAKTKTKARKKQAKKKSPKKAGKGRAKKGR